MLTSPPNFQKPPPGTPVFVTMPVRDLPRAQRFYYTVFGWRYLAHPSDPERVIYFTPGSIMGSLVLVKDSSNTTQSIATLKEDIERGVTRTGPCEYVLVEDVEETVKKIMEAGGMMERERFVVGDHTEMAFYRDTEGNVGGVLKWLMP
ncbi:hypothetical protein M501DRAFT_937612 [Patellaria atrata CBS 101060]|uniref:Glyoxalase/fosfomycin resistance/dioxygenase domain-containing protein n=1 Tax=Patellaria atrata CBS 101060 TaxID=1346257 RepID=A0A9P4S7Q4_9PEZI|nr:hypothetical protein M501DRAFT_937612 [Patellaria atrata CBS 101060]